MGLTQQAAIPQAQATNGKGPGLLQPGQPAAYGDLEVTLLSLKKNQKLFGVKLNNPKASKLALGAHGTFEEVYMLPKSLLKVEFHLLKSYNPKEAARWMLPIQ